MRGAAAAIGETPEAAFFRRGWVAFEPEPAMARWAAAARPLAEEALADADARAAWLRSGGTWFAGVNVFPNDAAGAVPARGVPPLSGAAVRFVAEALGLGAVAWDAAQISICLAGYPRPSEDESGAAFRYRRDRDAAHVDGLLRDAERRRYPGERHGFILGIPLAPAHRDAAPFVVWEGSQEIMRRALRRRLEGIPPRDWPREDVTEAYWAARREAFETCERVEVRAEPGGAYLVHRLALHGVAPWAAPMAGPGSEPRIIAYLRPDPYPDADPGWWLSAP